MTTGTAMLAHTRRRVDGPQRPGRNRLSTAITDTTSTSVVLATDTEALAEGTTLSIGLEVMIVESYVASTRTATVLREQDGSTASTHVVGTPVLIQPRFTDYDLWEGLSDEIVSLSGPNYFQIKTLDRTVTSGVYGYDLAADLIDIEHISYESTLDSSKRWITISRRHWDWKPNLDAGEFASTKALFLRTSPPVGQSMRIAYKARFSRLTALSDDVEAVSGLPETAHDIPPVGVAIALASFREIPHNDPLSQGQPRRTEEVPPGAILQSVRGALAWKQERLRQEKAALRNRYPLRVA